LHFTRFGDYSNDGYPNNSLNIKNEADEAAVDNMWLLVLAHDNNNIQGAMTTSCTACNPQNEISEENKQLPW